MESLKFESRHRHRMIIIMIMLQLSEYQIWSGKRIDAHSEILRLIKSHTFFMAENHPKYNYNA